MSKNYARSRVDKLLTNTGQNHGYLSRNNTGIEEKRTSVFDRLGTRRDNSSSVTYASSEVSGGSYKGRNEVLKSHSNAPRTGHSSTKRGSEIGHVRSRSPSASPRMKRKTGLHTSVSVKNKNAVKTLGVHEKDKVRKSSPKRTGVKAKVKSLHSSSKRKSGSKSGKKLSSRSKGKIRSSSLSSEESSSHGSTSSSSRSRSSSSTASEATTSSVTGSSTSSDSSAPSIKLKPTKKDKSKKKSKKKIKSAMRSSIDKPRHAEVPQNRQSVSSSGSSRDSRKDSGHIYKERFKGGDGPNWHKSPSRRSDSFERRSYSKSASRPVEKETPSSGRSYERERLGRSKERNFDEDSRKRRLSDDQYGVIPADSNYLSHKRSRTVPSPPPKYNKLSAPRRTPSPSPRRIPPESGLGHKLIARARSPPMGPSKERERLRIIRASPRRSSFDDHRRVDPRKDRLHGAGYGNGSKFPPDERERPFGHQHAAVHVAPNLKSEKSGYGDRDGRPRDRFAPARVVPLIERGRVAPKHIEPDRDRGRELDSPYDRIPRNPILNTPPNNKPYISSKTNLLQRPVNDDSHTRPLLHKRPSPLIPKSTESSLDRFDDQTIKQSRIDMWVDQTLQGGNRVLNDSYESEKSRTKRPTVDDRTFEEIKDKCSSLGSVSGGDVIESTTRTAAEDEKLAEDLSDFSDDADDLLEQAPDQCLSPKSEISATKNLGSHQNHEILVESVKEEPGNDMDEESGLMVASASVSSAIPAAPPVPIFDMRDSRSLQSQSQTDEDILEGMHFEAISDEELGEVENRVSIVDVFGVNWASLLNREKSDNVTDELRYSESSGKSVRQKWTPLQVFQEVGLSRKLCGDELFNKVVDRIKDSLKISNEDSSKQETVEKDLERPLLQKRLLERRRLLDTYGVGPHSRALSAKRDMILRRCLLNLPPKNLSSLEFGNQSSGPLNVPQDPDASSELLKISLANYKNT